MSSPATQLEALIPTSIINGSTSWVGKVGKLVSEPDQVAVFYDTGGQNPDPKWLLDYKTVQCIVRARPNDYATGYAKAAEIRDVLLGINPITLGSGDRIDGITMMADLTFINYDDSQRPTFSMNFRIFWEPASNGITNREPL